MSNLINQNWIGLDGKPVTGRVPPTIRMVAGVMTPALMAEVAHRYQLFCLNKQTAVGDFFVSDRTLPDGSRVRIVSNMGVDVVMVWSKYGPRVAELHHGLAVYADWMAAPLHRHKADGAIKFAGRAWQISGPDVTYGHCTITPDGKGPDARIFYPMVNGGTKEMWGLWKHKGNEGGKDGTIPLLLKYESGKGRYAFMKGRKLFAANGDVLYDMPDIPPRNPGEISTPQTLHPCATGDGKYLAFGQVRKLVVSAIFNRWNLLYGHMVLERKGGAYVPMANGMHTDNLTVPIGLATAFASSGDAGIDEEVIAELKLTTLVTTDGAFGTSVGGAPGGITIPWATCGRRWDDLEAIRIIRLGGYEKRADSNGGGVVMSDFMAAPSSSAMGFCSIVNKLNFPVKSRWQGGSVTKEIDASTYDGYGLVRKTKVKRNTEWEVDAPSISVELEIDGFDTVKLLEGATYGKMTGHKHSTTELRVNSYTDYGYYLTDNGAHLRPFPPWPERGFDGPTLGLKTVMALIPHFDDPGEKCAWVMANAVDFYAIVDACPPGETVEYDKASPRIIGRYDYTSRHIIDFDSSIGLMVAIRIRVKCMGATWKQKEDSYEGHMVPDQDPTYEVELALEWRVAGADGVKRGGAKILHKSTFVRPVLEFQAIEMPNVLRWPAPESEFTRLIMSMPPQLSPEPEAYFQLDNLANHQYVSPHFAGCEVVQAGEKTTEAGYEPSLLKDGVIVPHKRKPIGTLYARTIRLADFDDALWMLRKLKVDAPEIGTGGLDGPPAVPYFYCPNVLKAINEKFRLELTEDGEVNWTDLVPAKPGAAKPKAIDRDIKTFYV